MVICGNKVDLPLSDRKVRNRNITLPKKHNIQYYELSVKASYNIYNPLLYLARKLCGVEDLVFVPEPAYYPPAVALHLDASSIWDGCNSSALFASGCQLPEDCEYTAPRDRRWNRRKNWIMFLMCFRKSEKICSEEPLCSEGAPSSLYQDAIIDSEAVVPCKLLQLESAEITKQACMLLVTKSVSMSMVLNSFDLTRYVTLFL
jgi:hypothetical protein